ncbi:DUF4167 domain-containing protein [Aliiroseovarius lamellibrachiae]|uniref:DUF4167 domain-containing protein n=1 Tax=Aliiroseovarius lamellibrachiae TaxID=1924933 RepID=UPI001BDFF478|nr:DUF4167 domain-containing protein [Aliiroseovarius lamellibrachiae]MBT2132586.1 DUF4167 domain-containing protein [Aliiroseovarius lamellibrachiae]
MRSTKSRSRNKSNRNRNNNNNPGNIINRVFDSSGPEGKVRGTPQQIIEKYTQLARDAFLSNDRVAAENFQQHSEHYTRLLGEAQREVDARRVQAEQQNRERQQQQQQQRERDDRERKQPDVVDAPVEPAAPNIPTEQPDVISEPDSGLVETPESKPKKRAPRPRKPRKVEAAQPDVAPVQPAPAAPVEVDKAE